MSKLTVDECKRIILQSRKQLTAAEQRIAELEANNNSRWFKLFGTPERAVRTLQHMCSMLQPACPCCPVFEWDIDDCNNYDALLEWLNQEVSDEQTENRSCKGNH